MSLRSIVYGLAEYNASLVLVLVPAIVTIIIVAAVDVQTNAAGAVVLGFEILTLIQCHRKRLAWECRLYIWLIRRETLREEENIPAMLRL